MNYRLWEMEYAGSPKVLWSEVKPTPGQLTIAAKLGLLVSTDDTFSEVAASILEVVGHAIGCPSITTTDCQLCCLTLRIRPRASYRGRFMAVGC